MKILKAKIQQEYPLIMPNSGIYLPANNWRKAAQLPAENEQFWHGDVRPRKLLSIYFPTGLFALLSDA